MKKTNTFIPFFVGLLIPMLELEAQEQLDCEFNFREALYYLKLNDNSEENTLKITEYLTPCVEKGDDKAQLLMARFYLRSGSERDDEKAYKLLEKSAEQGNMIAAGDLGAMYKYGKGCDLNLTKAKKWFKKAAEAGNQKAIYSLGYLSLKGLGNIQQDYQQAIHWFEKSNYPMAKYWLGICYYHGYGVEKNIPKANQYLGANFENQPSNTRSTENTINDSESKYHEIENNEDSNQPTENITEGDVFGKWSGVLLKYDWSGKHIEQKVPIAINFKGETDEAFATYMLTIGEQKVEGYFNIIENAIDFEDLVLRDEFITIRNHISSVRLDRFIEFKELIVNDCSAIEDIDCDQIVHWQNLVQHQAPQSVVEKIKSLPSGTFNDFYIQELENANGTMVNLDYFGVNIVTLPINLSTGQRFTPYELLDYMRRDFNNFVSGSTFAPYCQIQSICAQETNLWNSNNPLGAIIYIDIPGDDGVVICTEYQNDYWYFQTMNAPYAGNHPVGGTRQFGYERLANGTYNFFVRGVDRIDSNIIENIAYFFTGGNPLIGADNLWRSFQDKLQRFVDNNSGRAVGTSPIRNRPDWNKVKSVLKGEKPISDLGCN